MWEYKVEIEVTRSRLQGTLTKLGEDGWELVTCERRSPQSSYYTIVLKRLNMPTQTTYTVD